MPIPDYVKTLREKIGTQPLWLPGVTGVILREGQVLLTLRKDNGMWALVSGILEPGESPAPALVREAREEACVDIRVDRVAGVQVVGPITYPNGDQATYLDTCLACTWLSGEPRVGDDENEDVRFFAVDALPERMADTAKERIQWVLSGGPAWFDGADAAQ